MATCRRKQSYFRYTPRLERVLPALSQLFPDTRVICCVRSPAWILDSVEQLVARNPLRISRMFDPRAGANIYQRVDAMMAKDGFVGMPLANLRQAWYSDQAARVIAIRYDSLAYQPAAVMNGLYRALGIAEFPHNFERVEYEEAELDARVNMPGLHTVAGRVEPRKRVTVLPPELFKQSDHSFWDAPGQNPAGRAGFVKRPGVADRNQRGNYREKQDEVHAGGNGRATQSPHGDQAVAITAYMIMISRACGFSRAGARRCASRRSKLGRQTRYWIRGHRVAKKIVHLLLRHCASLSLFSISWSKRSGAMQIRLHRAGATPSSPAIWSTPSPIQ